MDSLTGIIILHENIYTLVQEVFLDFSPHRKAAAKRRTGRSRSGEKENFFFLAARGSCSPVCGPLMQRKIKKNL